MLIGGARFTGPVADELRRHAVTSLCVVDTADVRSRAPKVVVVDVDAVDGPPLDVLDRLRCACNAAVVAVCAEEGRMAELLAVADDAFCHPDRRRELVARVRALLRRLPGDVETVVPTLAVGDVVLDRATHGVTVAGQTVALPLKQYRMLELLLAHAGQVVRRETLVARVWGADGLIASNTLEVQMKRLRAALGPAAHVTTVRGVGYRLEQMPGDA